MAVRMVDGVRRWPFKLGPRFAMLMVAAAGPLLALLIHSAVMDERREIAAAGETARQLATLAAQQQDDTLSETRTLLSALARVAAIQPDAGERCSLLLASVVADHPQLRALAVAGLDGIVTCASHPAPIGISIKGQSYFEQALAESGFFLSGRVMSRVTGLPTLFAAAPIPSEGASNAGVIVASLKLDFFARVRRHQPLGVDQVTEVIDVRDGTLIARSSGDLALVGERFGDAPWLAELRAHPEGGSACIVDLDGVNRVVGFMPVLGSQTGLYVVVGLNEAEIRGLAGGRSRGAIMLAVAAALAAVLTAWIVAHVSVLRPIRALSEAARQVGGGNTAATPRMPAGAAWELQTLGDAFSGMASRLSARQTELLQMQRVLADSEAHHRLLADTSNDLITRLTPDFQRIYVSPACLELTGYTVEEMLQRRPSQFIHPADRVRMRAEFEEPLRTGAPIQRACFRSIRKDGSEVWVESSGRRLPDGSGYVVVTRDVSERKLLEARLEEANSRLRVQAQQDGLTNLCNRRRFDELLGEEYRRAERTRQPLSLMMVDVDWFKPFNDLYGHPAGDHCLRTLAGLFTTVLRRSGDVPARYGGEEFAVLMPGTDRDGALAAAERLQHAVQMQSIPHAGSVYGIVTLSVGLAMLVSSAADSGPAELVEAADAALYRAKALGRNRICLADAILA